MTDDETEYLEPVFGSHAAQRFRPVRTIWFAAFQLFLVICLALASVFMIFFWPEHAPSCEPLYLLIYCHCAFWFIVLVYDHFLKWKHHILRLNGYLTAYEKLTKYGALPFFVVSLGLCVMMVVLTIYLQLSMIPFHCSKNKWFSPLIVALGTTLVESAVLAYLIIIYIVYVYRFNKVQPVPDVDLLDFSQTLPSLVRQEVGFRERGEVVEELFQNQADLIRHYREANEVLNRKVMGLTAQLRGDSIN